MLVLTRRPGEAIVIGSDVKITVLEVRGDQIRIGIDAPRSVKVHREEVYREIERTNADAISSAGRAADLARGGRLPRPPRARVVPPQDRPGADEDR